MRFTVNADRRTGTLGGWVVSTPEMPVKEDGLADMQLLTKTLAIGYMMQKLWKANGGVNVMKEIFNGETFVKTLRKLGADPDTVTDDDLLEALWKANGIK